MDAYGVLDEEEGEWPTPAVVWVCSGEKIRPGLPVDELRSDLAACGVNLLFSPDVERGVTKWLRRLGTRLRATILDCTRSPLGSGRERVARMRAWYDEAGRHVPMLTLGAWAADDPRENRGWHALMRWIVQQAMGIEKTVVFVRHGEAEHNVSGDANEHDPALTKRGRMQASQVGTFCLPQRFEADLIAVSPLRRTLETAALAMSGPGASFVLQPLLQELNDIPCDTGSDVWQLTKWFPDGPFDFSVLPDDWHIKAGIFEPARGAERVNHFVHWLRQQPQQCCIVVAHDMVLRLLLQLPATHRAHPSWENPNRFCNCEWRCYWLTAGGIWVPAPELPTDEG